MLKMNVGNALWVHIPPDANAGVVHLQCHVDDIKYYYCDLHFKKITFLYKSM